MMGGGMMGGRGPGGMMGGGMMGQGMMGYTQGYTNTMPFGFGPGGMMGGYGPGGMMGGMMGQGMMWNSNSPFFTTKPLTLVEATEAVNTYLANLNDANLVLHEIMIFDNHAYAEVVEKDSGIGAMELLIDPTTKAVYPEMGPNMMWNLKYGMMAGFGQNGMMGMMGGSFGFNNNLSPTEVSAEMPVGPEKAVEAAQTYLDTYLNNGLVVEAEAEPFYGYYTLHVSRDGETVGMLSVNGYTGQVFLHTWHGKLLELSEE
jgi:hypothetical protein